MRLLASTLVALFAASAAAAFDAPTAPAAVGAAVPVIRTAAEDPDQRVRCRRIAITGSNMRGPRVCKTVGEWARLSARGNDNARAIADSGHICAGGELCRGN